MMQVQRHMPEDQRRLNSLKHGVNKWKELKSFGSKMKIQFKTYISTEHALLVVQLAIGVS